MNNYFKSFRIKLETLYYNILASILQGRDTAPFFLYIIHCRYSNNWKSLIWDWRYCGVIYQSKLEVLLQNHLYILFQWFKTEKIKINEFKSVYVTFTLCLGNYPNIMFGNTTILHEREVKYLGLLFDRRLTWSQHLENKWKQLINCLHIFTLLL